LTKGDSSVTNDKGYDDDEIDRMLNALVMKGLVQVSSIDAETGEFLYQISDELRDALPGIKEETERMFLEQLDSLWIKGFVSMDKTLENPIVSLTELAFDDTSVKKLAFEERVTLYTVMEAMRQNRDN
jgi:hypothetical protein